MQKLPVVIPKERLTHIADALKNGKPILPNAGRWNGIDMLTLAGAAYLGALGMQKQVYPQTGQGLLEHREALAERFTRELDAAVHFIASMTSVVAYDEWDDRYKDRVVLLVGTRDGKPHVEVIEGIR